MPRRFSMVWPATAILLVVGSLVPNPGEPLWLALIRELAGLMPLIVIVALMAGWFAASPLAGRVRGHLDRRPVRAMMLASLFGAVTPVCGIASAPMVGALLRQGIPVSAAMAFLVSSPVTDPGMVLMTAGLLGWSFAAGKLLAAAIMGVVAGMTTAALTRSCPQARWIRVGVETGEPESCEPVTNRARFLSETGSTFLLVLRWLAFALTLEALIRTMVGEAGYALLESVEPVWAVPLAVVIGGPLYIEGYAALPLLRGMMDMGLTPGAAMAFLISGAAISLYSAMAVWHLVRPALFAVYLGVGLIGALLAGWLTDALMTSGGL